MTQGKGAPDASKRAICRAIAAGALFHDIGKFAERANEIPELDKDVVQQEYNYGHAHASEVALGMLFGDAASVPIPGAEKADATFANLASRHHKPRYYLERIIQVADWWASGHERAKADNTAKVFETTGRERKSQIPLLSILGRIRLGKGDDKTSTDWRYPLRPQMLGDDLDPEALYPRSEVAYTNEDAQTDYPRLWGEFSRAVSAGEKQSSLHPIEEMETLFEICRQYQWCIPASTRMEHMPDVSLFEHAKGTAAIASCLYYYHTGDAEPGKAELEDKATNKFLLCCADIAGIQKFIYQISSKGAYKLLKGRSFYVQLLSEIIARHLVATLGLTLANILYASGGKCYLLLPNVPWVKEGLNDIFASLNKELFQDFNGDLYVRHGCEEISGGDLCMEKGRLLNDIWEHLGQQVARKDRMRYVELPEDTFYDTIFAVNVQETHATCVVCHGTSKIQQKGNECRTCSDMKELGRQLGEARYILVSADKHALRASKTMQLPLGYNLWCLKEEPKTVDADSLVLWSVNSNDYIELAAKETIRRRVPCAPLMLGSNHRFEKEFDEIAGAAKGIRRLGILRMDVDNLGTIFSKGLSQYRHSGRERDGRFHSLARITTLSWQLRLFFEGLLPCIVEPETREENQLVTVVYSGGDDLFLLGAWDTMPEIALKIRQEFSRFCCQNPCFTLSGGLVLTGGSFPVYKSAEMAGDEEAKAKQLKSEIHGHMVEKAALAFLETPMHWEEFEHIKGQKDALIALLQDKRHWSLLRRLRAIAASWDEERSKQQHPTPCRPIGQIAKDIAAERWRWRMVYSLARYGQQNVDLRPVLEDLQRFIVNYVGASRRSGIELLHVLVRWVEYYNRQREMRNG